jgi:hemerythrin-like metal-binding protein
MAIQWTEDLATGSPEIDSQHKEIFRRINGLLDACNLGKGKDEVGRVIEFLDDYVVAHFGVEEKHMLKHGYPGYAEHKAKHEEFKKGFLTLKKKVETEGPGVHTVIATNQMVVDWFLNHIRKVDTRLGAFLKTAS